VEQGLLEAGKQRLVGDAVRQADSRQMSGLTAALGQLKRVHGAGRLLPPHPDVGAHPHDSGHQRPGNVRAGSDACQVRPAAGSASSAAALGQQALPCVRELRRFLESRQIEHTRGAPYHPMTQGTIERYHRSMKNLVQLQIYTHAWDLER
jgi:hypothetical protein